MPPRRGATTTSDGKPSLFTLYVDKKKAEVLVELPKDFEKKEYFIALTVASGELYAGLQEGDLVVVQPGEAPEVGLGVAERGLPQGEEALQRHNKGDIVKAKVLDVDAEKERISRN